MGPIGDTGATRAGAAEPSNNACLRSASEMLMKRRTKHADSVRVLIND